MTERRSMLAERDTTDRYLAAYLVDRVGSEFPGAIAGVARFGLFVKLDETGADGLVPISSLGREYFAWDPDAQTLTGETSRRVLGLGQRVLVRLAEAAPITGGLLFELLEVEGRSLPNSAAPCGEGRRRGASSRSREPWRGDEADASAGMRARSYGCVSDQSRLGFDISGLTLCAHAHARASTPTGPIHQLISPACRIAAAHPLARRLLDRHQRRAHLLAALAEQRQRVFGRAGVRLGEGGAVQRHQPVLVVERLRIVAGQRRLLELRRRAAARCWRRR